MQGSNRSGGDCAAVEFAIYPFCKRHVITAGNLALFHKYMYMKKIIRYATNAAPSLNHGKEGDARVWTREASPLPVL